MAVNFGQITRLAAPDVECRLKLSLKRRIVASRVPKGAASEIKAAGWRGTVGRVVRFGWGGGLFFAAVFCEEDYS